jgi:hypothetical protein
MFIVYSFGAASPHRSVRSGICGEADAAPDGARRHDSSQSYKHCAPPERGNTHL